MGTTSRRFPGGVSLFRTLFDEADLASPESFRRDPVLLLALARMSFLRSHEKLLLARTIDSTEELSKTSLRGAESIVLRPLEAGYWTPERAVEDAKSDFERFARMRVRFICVIDPEFPAALREIYRPPFGLYVRGSLADPCRPAVAIVGTRVPTASGVKAARILAHELAKAGVWVISGLARGIDSSAHRGAISGGGRTIAVLPVGIDAVYPVSNRPLASAIIDSGGGLATEYPPGTTVQKYRFPERNRIIAGLARGCVVIEAPERSGALITADHALEEGRDVYVHAASRGGTRNAGADALASQGAGIVNNAQDIFSEWKSGGV